MSDIVDALWGDAYEAEHGHRPHRARCECRGGVACDHDEHCGDEVAGPPLSNVYCDHCLLSAKAEAYSGAGRAS